MRRYLLLALLAALPVPAVAWGVIRLADHMGDSLGSALACAASLGPGSRPARGAHRSELLLRPRPLPVAPLQVQEAGRGRLVSRAGAGRVAAQNPLLARGIRVSASTVLRLANNGARPTGAPVAPSGARPAGLLLSGVGALGIGMRDGDILTDAGGRPALSEGDVVGVVIASRGQRVPTISGRFWRNGEPWQLLVEQPYLQIAPAECDSEAAPGDGADDVDEWLERSADEAEPGSGTARACRRVRRPKRRGRG
jgi:hypothetical protein